MWLYLDRYAIGAALCAVALVLLTLSLSGQ